MQDLAPYYFHSGINFNSYKYLGSHPLGGDKWVFRVWAKNAKQVYVTGDFCDWKEDAHPAVKISEGGIWEAVIEGLKTFDNYKYVIVTPTGKTIFKADPFAFHAELRPGTSSKLYDIEGYAWDDEKWLAKRADTDLYNSPINIYELHPGSWKKYPDGQPFDYRKLAEEIVSYITEMGYTHIELMGISEYPLDASWGYQVTGYFAPTARYGTPKDFMYLVDLCHQNGIGVILDWVPAHFPKDAFALYEFDGAPCFEYDNILKSEHPDWGTRVFDYGKAEVQSFLISSANYWFDKYHVDGLRVDAVASMLYLDYSRKDGQWIPNRHGGNSNLEAIEFLQKLNTQVFTAHQGIMMIAEESTAWPLVTYPVKEGGLGFNFKWNMGWMNDTVHYFSAAHDHRPWKHNSLSHTMTFAYSENYILPLSHDEVVHGKYSLVGKMPGEYENKFADLRAYLAYMYAYPGKKLLFMGAELPQFKEWNEDNALDWFLLDDYPLHRKFHKFARDLFRLYKKYPAFWDLDALPKGFKWVNYDDYTQSILNFIRIDKQGNQMLVVCNFSDTGRTNYRMGLYPGNWEKVLCSADKKYGGPLPNTKQTVASRRTPCHDFANSGVFDIPALSVTFYYKKKVKPKKK